MLEGVLHSYLFTTPVYVPFQALAQSLLHCTKVHLKKVSSRDDALFVSVTSQVATPFKSAFQRNLVSVLPRVDEPSGSGRDK